MSNEKKTQNSNNSKKDITGVNEMKGFDKNKAIYVPMNIFKTPQELIKTDKLTNAEILQALTVWELDCRLLEVADDENMPILQHEKKNVIKTQDVREAREKFIAEKHLTDELSGEHGSTTKLGM